MLKLTYQAGTLEHEETMAFEHAMDTVTFHQLCAQVIAAANNLIQGKANGTPTSPNATSVVEQPAAVSASTVAGKESKKSPKE